VKNFNDRLASILNNNKKLFKINDVHNTQLLL